MDNKLIMNLVMGLDKKPKKKLNKTIDLNDIDDCQNPVFSKIAAPAKKKKAKAKKEATETPSEETK